VSPDLTAAFSRPRLTRPEACAYLRERHGLSYSVRSLEKWAYQGGGPQFARAGKAALYTPEALDAFAARKIGPTVASTSELRQSAT